MQLILRTFAALFRGWTWRYAWRDGRSRWASTLLYTGSIVVGVAALVAIRSFAVNAKRSIETQSKELLGADLVVRSRQELSKEVTDYVSGIPGEQSEQRATVGMALIPKTDSTCLIQIRSSTLGYPFYGEVVTEPPGAYDIVRREGKGAIVEASMMATMELAVGDEIRVDGIPHKILAKLKEMPGESSIISQLAPRVLVPPPPKLTLALPFMPKRSANFTQISLKLSATADTEAIVETLKSLRKTHSFSFDTPETLASRAGRRLGNLFEFLGLVGFVALLLGGIGVAGSVNLYVRRKLPSVAMLRCLGAKAHQTIAVYLLQALWMGCVGGIVGAVLGTGMQMLLGRVFKDLLPFTVGLRVSWTSIGMGVATGMIATLLFALLPLLNVRRVSPLMTLRADLEPEPQRDPLRWVVYLVIAAAVFGFAMANTPKPIQGALFSVGLFLSIGILYGIARVVTALLKRAPTATLPFAVRQGLKNLHRPRNQTTSLTLCLGLGVLLIMGQYLADTQLVRHVSSVGDGDRPNLVLFEVGSSEIEGVESILRANGATLADQFPVAKMKLHSVKGEAVASLMDKAEKSSDRGRSRRGWVYRREYRVTSRGGLNDGETLIDGKIPDGIAPGKPVPITVEREQAKRLGVWIGDDLAFSYGDRVIETTVAGIRQVDWLRLQPTFFVVFPMGGLDGLPVFNAITARVPTDAGLATIKRETVKRYPQVWAVDMGTVVDAFTSIFDKLAFTVRFMALFSMGTGIIVLFTSVRNTREHRLRENALLRTLGARGRTIYLIMGVEYGTLGLLAAIVGNGLAVFASWAVSVLMFKLSYEMEWGAIALSVIAVTAATAVVGLLNSRSVTGSTPLEALRSTE